MYCSKKRTFNLVSSNRHYDEFDGREEREVELKTDSDNSKRAQDFEIISLQALKITNLIRSQLGA